MLQAFFADEKVETTTAIVIYDFDAPTSFAEGTAQTINAIFNYT